MTAVYENHGLRFMYPENWKLTDTDDSQLPFQIGIETPAGGIWSVNVFDGMTDTLELLDAAIEGLQESYEDIEVTEARDSLAGLPTYGIDTYFYCLDFMVMARIRVVETDHYKLVFHFQAESRDFDQQRDVFLAIATSLIQSLD